jgi:hypothetical protein
MLVIELQIFPNGWWWTMSVFINVQLTRKQEKLANLS